MLIPIKSYYLDIFVIDLQLFGNEKLGFKHFSKLIFLKVSTDVL